MKLKAFFGVVALALAGLAQAQPPVAVTGETIPRDVREMYDRGLEYLAASQSEAGDWKGSGQSGPGITGLGALAFLASGEDPNYGLYAGPVRKALRRIIADQDATTGYLGSSMYHHGFAMLALAEAYGAVQEQALWADADAKGKRSIGLALELAVRTAITSQKKSQFGAWRYTPDSTDADTSVSGAVLVGLLAARNAGIEVPDEAINRAVNYYQKMTAVGPGTVGYSGGIGGMGESLARSSIATLVYAVARRKDLPEFKATLGHVVEQVESPGSGPYPEYTRYYQAQALFQGDVAAWEQWNKALLRQFKQTQRADGSFPAGSWGAPFSTSMSLLAMALNYKFLPIYER